jgi:hypothetical protein
MLHYHPHLFKLTTILLLAKVLLMILQSLSIHNLHMMKIPHLSKVARGTREVHCTWCNTYVKHGRERLTRSALYKHQKGSKCRLRLIGEFDGRVPCRRNAVFRISPACFVMGGSDVRDRWISHLLVTDVWPRLSNVCFELFARLG